MAPKAKITKKMIIDAAFEIVRSKGYDHLSTRSIAEDLHCSTQPILYNFKTVDDLRKQVYQKADAYHTSFIMPAEDSDKDPMLTLGLNYVRFGYEEKQLFCFLFQTNSFGNIDVEKLKDSPRLLQVLDIMAKGLKVSIEEAREMFFVFFFVVHGLASLLANNSMTYDEDSITEILTNVYQGVIYSKKGEGYEPTL